MISLGQSGTGWDIAAVEIATGRSASLRETPSNEVQARLSPDNRWIAYASDETGRWEIFVEPYPQSGARWQVSTDGGSQPVWRRDGSELFFLAPDAKLMSVTLTLAGTLSHTRPNALFQTRIRPPYAPYP